MGDFPKKQQQQSMGKNTGYCLNLISDTLVFGFGDSITDPIWTKLEIITITTETTKTKTTAHSTTKNNNNNKSQLLMT